MSTYLPKGLTLLSLNKKEILDLPGFKHLKQYLLPELRNFIRSQLPNWTNKKKGFTVKEYLDTVYKGEDFTPSFETKRKVRKSRK